MRRQQSPKIARGLDHGREPITCDGAGAKEMCVGGGGGWLEGETQSQTAIRRKRGIRRKCVGAGRESGTRGSNTGYAQSAPGSRVMCGEKKKKKEAQPDV